MISLEQTLENRKKAVISLSEITGRIADKDMALKMLCRTNKAWDLLTPELKADSDVMMCYQPTGMFEQVSVNGSNPLAKDVFVEEGFEQFVYEGRRSTMLVPTWAKDVKGFDYRAYFTLQSDMQFKASVYADVEDLRSQFGKKLKDFYSEDMEKCFGDAMVSIYDRDVLRKKFGVEDPEFQAVQR